MELQIETMLIAGGVVDVITGKCNDQGRKHYHAALRFGLHGIKDNARLLRKKLRTSSEVDEYGNRFIERFRKSFNKRLELDNASA